MTTQAVDYLVLGNCQSVHLSRELRARRKSVANFIMSYPGLFSSLDLNEQKRRLQGRIGSRLYTTAVRSGLILPEPSLSDLKRVRPKRICCTVLHPRNIYEYDENCYFSSNVDIEKKMDGLPFALDNYAKIQPAESYVEGYASLMNRLTESFPGVPITVLVRASAFPDLFENATCWLGQWPMIREEFIEKVSAGWREQVRLIHFDAVVERLLTDDRFFENLEYVHIAGKRCVDMEHLPQPLWDEVTDAVEAGNAIPLENNGDDFDPGCFVPLKDLADFTTHVLTAQAFASLGDKTQFLAQFSAACSCGSVRRKSLVNLMVSGLDLGVPLDFMRDKAEGILRLLSVKDRDRLYTALGKALSFRGRYEEAHSLFGRVLEPASDTLIALGVLWREQKKYENALECFERVIQTSGGPSSCRKAVLEFVITAYQSGQKELAFQYIAKFSDNPASAPMPSGVEMIPIESLGWQDALVIGTAPLLTVDYLLAQLLEHGVNPGLLTRSVESFKDKVPADMMYKLPKGRFSYANHQLSDAFFSCYWDGVIVTVADLTSLHDYANILELCQHIKTRKIMFYATSQVLGQYCASSLLQYKDAVIEAARGM